MRDQLSQRRNLIGKYSAFNKSDTDKMKKITISWGFSIHYSSKSMILKSDKMQFPLSLMNYIFFLVTFKSYCRSMAHSYLLPAELLKWLLRFLGLSMSLRSENRYVKQRMLKIYIIINSVGSWRHGWRAHETLVLGHESHAQHPNHQSRKNKKKLFYKVM